MPASSSTLLTSRRRRFRLSAALAWSFIWDTSLRLGWVDTPSLQGGPDETTGSGITTRRLLTLAAPSGGRRCWFERDSDCRLDCSLSCCGRAARDVLRRLGQDLPSDAHRRSRAQRL